MSKRLRFVSILLVLMLVFVGCTQGATGNDDAASEAENENETAAENSSIKTYEGSKSSDELTEELGEVPQPSEEYRIGVVLKTLSNEHWQEMKRGYEEAAAKYGVKVDVQAAATESDLSGQLSIAETMLNKDYDAIAISPLSQSNMQAAVEMGKEKGIPVINVDDSRVDGVDVFVGGDHGQMGVMAAEYIAEKLDGSAKVAQIEGQAGSPAAELRSSGFKETVGKSNNLELAASQPGDWDRLKSLDAAKNIMRSNPDIKAFYANNDTMAVGVVEALFNEGLMEDIIVIGTDGVPDAIKSIRVGGLTATVATFPYEMGYTAVEVAIRLLEGQEVPKEVISKQLIVDKDNVDEHFPE